MTSQNKKALEALLSFERILNVALGGGEVFHKVNDPENVRAALQPAPIDIESFTIEQEGTGRPIEVEGETRFIKESDYLASRGLITQKVEEIPGLAEELAATEHAAKAGELIFPAKDKAARAYHELTQQGEVR